MKILLIGNSYTHRNQLDKILETLLTANGVPAAAERSTAGSYTLLRHADPSDPVGAKTLGLLAAGDWDAVFLQEQSIRPLRQPDAFFAGAGSLAEIVRRTNPHARLLFYATWSRRADAPELAESGLDFGSMTEGLAARYREAASHTHAELSPVGEAFRALLAKHPEIELYRSDRSHPSFAGSVLAAVCHASLLTGKKPESFAFPEAFAKPEEFVYPASTAVAGEAMDEALFKTLLSAAAQVLPA